jgi:hypothetical protein
MEPRKIRSDEIEQVIRLTLDIREDLDLTGIKSFLRWQKDLWYRVEQSAGLPGKKEARYQVTGQNWVLTHILHNNWPVVMVHRYHGDTLILVNSPVALEGIAFASWKFDPIKETRECSNTLRSLKEDLGLAPNLNKDILDRGQSMRDLKMKLRAGSVRIPDRFVPKDHPGTWTEEFNKGFNSPAFDGHEVQFRTGNHIEVWAGKIWVAPSDHPNSEYRAVFGRTGGMLPDEFDFDNRPAYFLRAMRLYMLGRGFAYAWTCTGVATADNALTFRMSRGQARMEVCIAAAEVRHFRGGVPFFRGFHQLLALKIRDHQ